MLPLIASAVLAFTLLITASAAHAAAAPTPTTALEAKKEAPSLTTDAEAKKAPTDALSKLPVPSEEFLKKHHFDLVFGNPGAMLEVIEYASLSCSHCAEFHKDVFPAITEKYINTQKIKFIFRDFPLNASALEGAQLTHCVPREKYFDFLKVLFKTQESWAYKKNYLEMLANIAKLGGINGETFDKCIQNNNLKQEILRRRQEAVDKYAVKGTPTFIINGTQYPAMDVAKFSATLDALLEDETAKSAETSVEKKEENPGAAVEEKKKAEPR